MIVGEGEARLQRRVRTTVGSATLLTLIAYPFVLVEPAEAGRLELPGYLVVVALGSAVAMAMASRPVARSLAPHHRLRAAHVCTAVLLATVTGAIAFSGGSFSELHHLLALPLVFAAIAYPRRVVLALLALTVALVAVTHVVTASPFLPARTALRVATVGGSVLVTSWLTAAHSRQLHRTRRARDETDRQAAVLRALAHSAADVNDLDHETVLDAAVTTAVRIGYDGAAFLVLRDGGVVMVEHAGAGTPDQPLVAEDDLLACLDDGTPRTVVVDGVSSLCLPVVVDDRAVGALVGATHDGEVDPDGVGLRILAAHAATALTNAHRFRSTRELVDQLRDLERLRHDLVSTASHELRTPTTVIKAAAELLDGRWADLRDGDRRRFVRRIHAHVGALEHVLDQLATFVDLDTGTGPRLERGSLDLAELAETCISEHRHALTEHTVIARLAPAEVIGDAASLRRVISALLDNVATHTPAGTTVRIVTEHTDHGASLLVTDDGAGVPDEIAPTLLAPFARSGDVLTRGTRGVGLGLTLVDHTVRAHGGEVVLSADGGFAVRIHLPAPVTTAVTPATTAAGPASSHAPDPRRPRALVVEDDPSVRQLARLTLEGAGCAVRATGDGRSALTIAAEQRPDVVVLDVDLPGLDGREVARALRDDPATADVPIVVVTGSADRKELWTIWASGADALLTKPFDVTELASTVVALASRAHTSVAASEAAGTAPAPRSTRRGEASGTIDERGSA